MTTRTNWPGQSASSVFGKSAFMRIVPAAWSTWLSTNSSTPPEGLSSRPGGAARTPSAPSAMRRRTSARLRSGRVKDTSAGCISLITTSGAVSFAFTRLPGWASRLPVRPVSGAVMVQ